MGRIAIITLLLAACASGGGDAWEPGRSRVPIGKNEGGERRSCGSDLTCPLGFVCAKRAGAFTGDCLRAVDENGSPVFVPQSSDSYGPGPSQCAVDRDCPSRFRCDEGR